MPTRARARHAFTAWRLFASRATLPFFELARVLVRFDDVASVVVNVDHTRAALPTSVTLNTDKVWVVYQKNMRKTMLLTVCALLLGTTVIAGDFAADPLNFRNPQQDLIDNSSEMLPEMKELQSCEEQQEEALQRFLEAGLSLNAAALMAHNQYPCDSTDQ